MVREEISGVSSQASYEISQSNLRMFNEEQEDDRDSEEKNNETEGALDLTQLTSVAQLKV